MEAYFTKLGTDLTTPEMQAPPGIGQGRARLHLQGRGETISSRAGPDSKRSSPQIPTLRLTRQETDQFGELLLAAKDYPTALKIYNDLLTNTPANDQAALGDAYYGLGATYLGQGDVTQAKVYFLKLKALPGGGAWHPHILDANFGIALADEQAGQPADIAEAQGIYGSLMQAPQGGVTLQAKAMLRLRPSPGKSGPRHRARAAGAERICGPLLSGAACPLRPRHARGPAPRVSTLPDRSTEKPATRPTRKSNTTT